MRACVCVCLCVCVCVCVCVSNVNLEIVILGCYSNYHMMSHEQSCVDLTAGEKAFEAVIHHLGPVKALQQVGSMCVPHYCVEVCVCVCVCV